MSSSPSTPSTERLASLIRELLLLFMHRTSGEMLSIMSEAKLSMPQMVTLHMLECNGSHSISAIAGKLGLSLAATSHLVDRMVHLGFVVRSEDTLDRRHKRVAITESGRALVERLVQARIRDGAQQISELSPDLRNQLEHVLEQVVGQLKHADRRH